MHNSITKLLNQNYLLHWTVFAIAIHFLFVGCFEEKFDSNVSIDIGVSLDTVRFDTVFTTVGSTTKAFVIHNNSDQNVNLSSIKVRGGENSNFRINVDGLPGLEHREIPVLANDSLYVFVEVTVDPDQPLSVSPFIINDYIEIRSGESQKDVLLEAWGQNANYFPSRDASGQLIGLSCGNGNLVWDDPKPYVVYGLLFIDSCHLIIPEGTRIYFHGGLRRNEDLIFNDGGMVFLESGRISALGSAEQPILMASDRLEDSFLDVPGQWAGIRFFRNSRDNSLNFTTIRNSIVGIRMDSSTHAVLDGVTIAHTSNIGVIGIHADLEVTNSLIYDNGPQSVALTYGGDYSFSHTTIANYENQSAALYMDNFNCLNDECSAVDLNPLKAYFYNSIIMGSNEDEIDISDVTEGSDAESFQVMFDHTLIRANEVLGELSEEACSNCLQHNGEPVFLDQPNDLYSLDTMSVARNQGIPIQNITTDILGVLRKADTPDLGCFEFIE